MKSLLVVVGLGLLACAYVEWIDKGRGWLPWFLAMACFVVAYA